MKIVKYTIWIFLIFTSSSCSLSNISIDNNLPLETNKGEWSIEESKIEPYGKFKIIYFTDKENGWIGGEKGIFKTNDSGRTWKQSNLTMPVNSEVAYLFFANTMQGKAVIMTTFSLDRENAQFWVFSTENGGNSWNLDFTSKNSVVLDAKFFDINNGWITGTNESESACRKAFLIHFQNEKWEKTSEFTNLQTTDERNRCNDLPVSLILNDEKSLTIITHRRKLLQSFDSGQSWNIENLPANQDEQARLIASGITDQKKIWFSEGTSGTEGVRGRFYVDGIINSMLGNYFSDVVYLKENEFMASVTEIKQTINQQTKKYQNTEVGTLQITSDNGKTWTDIYKKPDTNEIISLSYVRSGKNYIWGLTENGKIILLTNEN